IDAECFIESLVLCQGLVQICLRTYYVCAWQRTEDRELTDAEVKPYFEERKAEGSLFPLIRKCEEVELLEPEHANLLRMLNNARNRAAHGVMTCEIEPHECATKRSARSMRRWVRLNGSRLGSTVPANSIGNVTARRSKRAID